MKNEVSFIKEFTSSFITLAVIVPAGAVVLFGVFLLHKLDLKKKLK
jgi:hypothetical protein